MVWVHARVPTRGGSEDPVWVHGGSEDAEASCLEGTTTNPGRRPQALSGDEPPDFPGQLRQRSQQTDNPFGGIQITLPHHRDLPDFGRYLELRPRQLGQD